VLHDKREQITPIQPKTIKTTHRPLKKRFKNMLKILTSYGSYGSIGIIGIIGRKNTSEPVREHYKSRE